MQAHRTRNFYETSSPGFESAQNVERSLSQLNLRYSPFYPDWASRSGGKPTIGDGVLSGEWCRFGWAVWVNIFLKWGNSTIDQTGGEWTFRLPFAPAMRLHSMSGSGRLRDISTIKLYTVVPQSLVDPGYGSTILVAVNDQTSYLKATVPFTWAFDDRMSISLNYPTLDP